MYCPLCALYFVVTALSVCITPTCQLCMPRVVHCIYRQYMYVAVFFCAERCVVLPQFHPDLRSGMIFIFYKKIISRLCFLLLLSSSLLYLLEIADSFTPSFRGKNLFCAESAGWVDSAHLFDSNEELRRALELLRSEVPPTVVSLSCSVEFLQHLRSLLQRKIRMNSRRNSVFTTE